MKKFETKRSLRKQVEVLTEFNKHLREEKDQAESENIKLTHLVTRPQEIIIIANSASEAKEGERKILPYGSRAYARSYLVYPDYDERTLRGRRFYRPIVLDLTYGQYTTWGHYTRQEIDTIYTERVTND